MTSIASSRRLPANPSKRRFIAALTVIGLLLLWVKLVHAHKAREDPQLNEHFRQGKIESAAIRESSGIVASRQFKEVFWTHNDSGNPPVIYAITREGKSIAEFPVEAKNRDWEDIAIDDEGHIYLSETGNNDAKMIEPAVYRLTEPDPRDPANAGKTLRLNRVYRLKYPDDKPFDCEALCVYKGTGYVIPKYRDGTQATLYKFDLGPHDDPMTLEAVTKLPIHSPVTGADISADGKQLAILTLTGPRIFQIDGDVAKAGKVEPKSIPFVHSKHEGVCFVPEGLLTTTEDRDMFLFRWKDFGVTKENDQ